MRRTKLIWGVCLALIATPAFAGPEVGDYSGLPPGLAAAAGAYDVAQFKSDRAEIARLLADDYVLAGTDGKNHGKAEALADAAAPGRTTSYVAISDQVRQAWSDGAVLGGMVDATGVDRGKPFKFRGRFVDVWAKRQGRWQVIFTQIHDAK